MYHAGALGDFVLSLPAVFRVAQAYPGLAWNFWGARERLALLPGFGPAPPELLRSGHTLWGGSPAPDALAALGRYRAVLAFGGRELPRWVVPPGPRVLRVASFPPPNGAWVPAHQAAQLEAQGVPPPRSPWLPGWKERVLACREPSEIVLHPGSGDPGKNLPQHIWADALALLSARTGLPVTLILGPAEQERGGWEVLASRADVVRACTGVPELLAALSRARLFLGNDSGASHLAGALGIPTVVAFGPSDPRLWHPLGPRVAVVQRRAACGPCTAGEPIRCQDRACLAELTALAVADAATGLLAAPDEGGGPPV